MFAIQFLNTGEVWLMVKPLDITEISKYITTGICIVDNGIEIEDTDVHVVKKIKSSENAREAFKKEREKKYDKTRYAK